MLIAMIVGWKRNWCIEAFTELAGSDGTRAEQADDVDGLGDSGEDGEV